MADFSGKQNLMAFKGAKLVTGIDEERPSLVYVAIPVAWNDIEVSQDGQRAMSGIYLNETTDKFRQACRERRQMSGESMDGYLPPSHTMEVRFSKEFREKALVAARKRLLIEHPEWAGDEDPQHNTELRNAMYDAVRVRLGSLYLSQRQASAPSNAQPQYAQAQGAQAYQPDMQPADASYDDDLPF
jgi:hypothetical protein